jgi:hypothetical protein
MEPKPIPKNNIIYMMIYQLPGSVTYSAAGPGSNGLGSGFYLNERDAEHQRTIELLKNPSNTYLIYELTVPNPAYKQT